jgi:predicted alpha/beta hydrolase family esterase
MQQFKNYIFVHGTYRSKDRYIPMGQGKGWMTWAKGELERDGFTALTPDMPTPWEPTYTAWKNFFATLPVHENSTIVGHSAGGAFLVRWLGDTKTKIKKLVLVSPGKTVSVDGPTHNADLYDFIVDPNVYNLAEEIVLFTSDAEPLYRQTNIQIYKDILRVEPIVVPNHGHFTYTDMGTEEFPELLAVLLA